MCEICGTLLKSKLREMVASFEVIGLSNNDFFKSFLPVSVSCIFIYLKFIYNTNLEFCKDAKKCDEIYLLCCRKLYTIKIYLK